MQDKVTKILKAIADPKRRDIFHALVFATTALSITQITHQFTISRQGVTKHIKTLEEAGLVHIKNEGRERFCSAVATPLRDISEWLKFYEQFWENALHNLESYLDENA